VDTTVPVTSTTKTCPFGVHSNRFKKSVMDATDVPSALMPKKWVRFRTDMTTGSVYAGGEMESTYVGNIQRPRSVFARNLFAPTNPSPRASASENRGSGLVVRRVMSGRTYSSARYAEQHFVVEFVMNLALERNR
jgi:hypothetical protein